MNNKTTALTVLAIMVVLLAGFWYFGWGEKGGFGNQAASVLGGDDNKENPAGELPLSGIAVTEVDGDLVLGDLNAPVTMIEYSSHLCGHCINFHLETLPAIMDKYVKTGKVKLIPRVVSPLVLGRAVLCAQEQNSFEAFNEYLFKHVGELTSVDDIEGIAGKLNLDQESFGQCLDSERNDSRVEKWFGQANQDGISGTPTFFINGQEIVGEQPLSNFENVIDSFLNE